MKDAAHRSALKKKKEKIRGKAQKPKNLETAENTERVWR
jgi:hypothetical protein